ncbi:MAG: PKD domain-containing protein [Candidatus Poseidoniales archaeon]|nr:MAG: PKD domain-containing protein [Candidatus Poseidoniales archaeon]|tara:strand:+ start:462 stop:1640 length:1179 start_codon:yes stop_codon:yes gene_type:complete
MRGMRTVHRAKSFSLSTLILLSIFVSGCIGLDSTVNPRASLDAYPLSIQEGETVTFDARDSEAVEGVVTGFEWDFGNGQKADTVVGFTSHTYDTFGVYTVTLTVINSQGGEDDISTTIVVNGAPVLNLTIPEQVKSGDSAFLDASKSFDPEGKDLTFAWDLDWTTDSNSDGDQRNDIDATTPTVLLPTNTSGRIVGSLVISDGTEASVSESFTIEVTTRTFEVKWITEELIFTWDDYLEQGNQWEDSISPGENGRIMEFTATLELDQELGPQDNFTLTLLIENDKYEKTVQTEGGNITANETAKATMDRDGINPEGKDGIFTADSEEDLMNLLVGQAGSRTAQGVWTWTVFAQQADPDPLIDGMIDPDPGNDWDLEVIVIVMSPVLTEITFG